MHSLTLGDVGHGGRGAGGRRLALVRAHRREVFRLLARDGLPLLPEVRRLVAAVRRRVGHGCALYPASSTIFSSPGTPAFGLWLFLGLLRPSFAMKTNSGRNGSQ